MSISAFAQITTSSLDGRVLDGNGASVIGAAVVATHEPSGTTYGVVTNNDGRYTIQGMRSGGPYKVEVSCLGYQTVSYTEVFLQLGEMFKLDAQLNEDKEMLSEALVVAASASKFSIEKNGASTNISNTQMEAVPSVSRNLTDVAKLSPYGGNGMSFAGGDGRSANFTIDGANFNNNFGLSDKLPGGGNPISIDAIEEVQVVVSPYDVRQTNFIGGGLNAITKSGTNTYKSSIYAYHNNELMKGNTINGESLGERQRDRTTTCGVTLGGPIIKNKLFYFVNFEYIKRPTVVNRWRPSTDGFADPDKFISRTTVDDLNRVHDHLLNEYGYEAGSYDKWGADNNNMKVLARIDWNITDKHHLAVRYNYTLNNSWRAPNGSSSNCGKRTTENRLSQYSMAFSNSMYSMQNIVHSLSVDLNSRISNDLSNQFLFTFSKLDDVRGSKSDLFPFIDILDGHGVNPYISAGYELFTYNNAVHNTVITLKDDVTYYKGSHKITAGLSYEYQMADNSYMRNGSGYYRYNNIEDFINGATPETVALTYGYDGEKNPSARVRFHQIGLYAQDEWNANDNFKLTYGLRLDALAFSNKDLMTNNAILEKFDYNGTRIDTGKWPSTKLQVSPRIGFTWDILGDKSLKLRGGTGLFAGRLPLVFFTNMPSNSGMVQNVTSITTEYPASGKPEPDKLLQNFAGKMITDPQALFAKFNELDASRFPETIKPEDGVAPKTIQAVDRKFRMPQVWKTSIAIDYAFPTSFPFSITGEFIYNKTVNGVNMQNINMRDPNGFAHLNGADNRPIFPSAQEQYIQPDGTVAMGGGKDPKPILHPAYKYSHTDAYMLTNTNKGYGYAANVAINISPIKDLHFTASYTHTVSKELTGLPGSNAESAFTYTPTVYGPNHPGLHNSQYMNPDRFFLSVSYKDKGDNRFGLFYEASRGGRNYSYMYDGDLNGDSYAYDLMYIPKDESEIKFASQKDADRYWAFANKDKYLSKHKGSYAEAYSVYSPWLHRVDFRYSHDFKFKAGKHTNILQLNLDLKNVANLFKSSWGVMKVMNPGLKDGRILELDHLDGEGVPVFKTNKNVDGNTQTWTSLHTPGQCWSLQVGIKFMFN